MANTVSKNVTKDVGPGIRQTLEYSLDTKGTAVSADLALPSQVPDEYSAVVTSITTGQDVTLVVGFDIANGEVDLTPETPGTFTAGTARVVLKWDITADQDGSSITSGVVY